MTLESKKIEFEREGEVIQGEITFSEEAEDDEENVYLKVEFNGRIIERTCFNFFEALNEIRKQLEDEGIQIRCNGASESVYPSPMLLSMGVGRNAYHNILGKHATKNNIVDIFEMDNRYKFVSIEKQRAFHSKWIESLRNLQKGE